MKLARHEKIIELIKEYDIDTQEELAARLNEAADSFSKTLLHRRIPLGHQPRTEHQAGSSADPASVPEQR